MTLTVTTAGDTAVPTIPGTKEFVQWYTMGYTYIYAEKMNLAAV